jgi:FtsP/CotA-like multicopper oxidase with cupredoxin domain
MQDVGQNTFELWMFKTGGGWYHPIHVHLIDFLVIQRDGTSGVLSYESMTPKDVVFLGPSQKIWVIARCALPPSCLLSRLVCCVALHAARVKVPRRR